jgi:hypothetical protein
MMMAITNSLQLPLRRWLAAQMREREEERKREQEKEQENSAPPQLLRLTS